jgi:hypothetical protein
MIAMLVLQDGSRTPALLANRLREVPIAATLLRSQQAVRRVELNDRVSWCRIREQALRRFDA